MDEQPQRVERYSYYVRDTPRSLKLSEEAGWTFDQYLWWVTSGEAPGAPGIEWVW